MNRMYEIAKILGVEVNQAFQVDGYGDDTFAITDDGLTWHHGRFAHDADSDECCYILLELIRGELMIAKPVRFPEHGTKYWYVSYAGNVYVCSFTFSSPDVTRYKLGNFYASEADARADANKWITFYNNPKPIDIFCVSAE